MNVLGATLAHHCQKVRHDYVYMPHILSMKALVHTPTVRIDLLPLLLQHLRKLHNRNLLGKNGPVS